MAGQAKASNEVDDRRIPTVRSVAGNLVLRGICSPLSTGQPLTSQLAVGGESDVLFRLLASLFESRSGSWIFAAEKHKTAVDRALIRPLSYR